MKSSERRFTDSLVAFEEDYDHLKISGFLGKPEYTKRTRGEQFLFLNKRYVINKAVNHAAFSAYENLIDRGDFPFFAIFIDIPPNEVDVNVHPSKLEVKFRDETKYLRSNSFRDAQRTCEKRFGARTWRLGRNRKVFQPHHDRIFARRICACNVQFQTRQLKRFIEDDGIADAVDPLFALRFPQVEQDIR